MCLDTRLLLERRFCRSLEDFQLRPEFIFRFFFHPINEEDALQVVGFVLDGTGEQPAAAKFDWFAFLVRRLHIDNVWP